LFVLFAAKDIDGYLWTWEFCGVYSSHERAEAAWSEYRAQQRRLSFFDRYWIFETELDAAAVDLPD
jgi:hypothetical protein